MYAVNRRRVWIWLIIGVLLATPASLVIQLFCANYWIATNQVVEMREVIRDDVLIGEKELASEAKRRVKETLPRIMFLSTLIASLPWAIVSVLFARLAWNKYVVYVPAVLLASIYFPIGAILYLVAILIGELFGSKIYSSVNSRGRST